MLRVEKKVIVTLTPTRLEATLLRGDKVVSTTGTDLDPARWDASWSQGLHSLDAPLAELLGTLRAQKCNVSVLYIGREIQSDVATYPMVQDEAVAAARLALAAEIASARQGMCCALWAETIPAIKSHVLVASDRTDNVIILCAWVRRGGGVPASCLPLNVPQVVQCVRSLVTNSTEKPVCHVLLGEHSTVLAGCRNGQVVFVRSADMGFSQFVKALVQASAESSAPITYAAAREYFLANGLPTRDNWVGGPVRGDRAMPLMYPVVQRYVVECRQTLRFGFGAEQSNVNVELVGPGGEIQGFAGALSAQLECDVNPSTGQGEVDFATARDVLSAHGFLADYERDEGRLKSLSTGLGVGLALAIVLLGGEYIMLRNARVAVENKITSQASQVTTASSELRVRREAAKLANELSGLQTGVAFAERNRVDSYAVFSELSRITPENVYLEEMGISHSEENILLSLRGTVATKDAAVADPLSEFLAALRDNPMVEAVELGSTRMFDVNGSRNKEFSLNARLVRSKRSASGDKH